MFSLSTVFAAYNARFLLLVTSAEYDLCGIAQGCFECSANLGADLRGLGRLSNYGWHERSVIEGVEDVLQKVI